MNALALDIGGTKIDVCHITRNYQTTAHRRYSSQTTRAGTPAFLEDIKIIIKDNLKPNDKKICLSFNCAVFNGTVVTSSLLSSNNLPLNRILSKTFGRPCFIENDVKCMALAERVFGKGKYVENLVLINIGTGLAITAITEGKLLRGYRNQAGEIGSLFEHTVSGRGLACIYKTFKKNKTKTAEEIFQSDKSDSKARRAITFFQTQLGELLKTASLFYNPELLILTGSVTKSAPAFLSKAIVHYRSNTSPYFHARKIEVSRLRHSACLGAVLSSNLKQ